MAKKELTALEHNEKIWVEVKKLEEQIAELKKGLKPAELPKQASLNECNALARKAVVPATKINPKLVAGENV